MRPIRAFQRSDRWKQRLELQVAVESAWVERRSGEFRSDEWEAGGVLVKY